jgi:hypothetical protein
MTHRRVRGAADQPEARAYRCSHGSIAHVAQASEMLRGDACRGVMVESGVEASKKMGCNEQHGPSMRRDA